MLDTLIPKLSAIASASVSLTVLSEITHIYIQQEPWTSLKKMSIKPTIGFSQDNKNNGLPASRGRKMYSFHLKMITQHLYR